LIALGWFNENLYLFFGLDVPTYPVLRKITFSL